MFLAELRTLIAYSYTEGSNQNVSDEILEVLSQVYFLIYHLYILKYFILKFIFNP
jgi:hypothetical protein